MNKEQFRQLLATGPILLDGATGTHLQAAGMPAGICPETWVLENPAILQDLQRAYLAAGSTIIYSFTFGANRPKLTRHQLPTGQAEAINRRLAEISIKVRDEYRLANPGQPAFVAGDLAPTGRFLFPAGDLSFSELVDIYREQVRGLLAAGVDLFVAETMMDLSETRAAVLAVQSECELPILTSLTFEANGRTLSGNSPLEGLLTLAGLGASAFGVNCSFGPDKLGELIAPLRSFSRVPLLLKPNAGLPQLIDGQTVFPMDPPAFAAAMLPLAADNVLLLGGCCGTGPGHIRQLRTSLDLTRPGQTAGQLKSAGPPGEMLPDIICSSRQSWLVEDVASLPVIECSDPESLIDDVYEVLDDDPPALVLDLDSAAEDGGELDDLLEILQQLQVMVAAPLVFRSQKPGLLEKLLYYYNGRAGVITSLPDRNNCALYL